MRIISGFFRSKRINPPVWFSDRPTTDMAKESLFNILNNLIDYQEVSFLDLFSGTGGISYEMASRGCKNIVCVDNNRRYCDFINKTFKQMYPQKSPAGVIVADAFSFIKNNPLHYDVIFADPPYNLEGVDTIPEIIMSNPSLSENTLVIIEHSKSIRFSDLSNIKDQRHYGKVNFSFFKKGE